MKNSEKIVTLVLLPTGVCVGRASVQYTYGTTGLLNMPTADMQRCKIMLTAISVRCFEPSLTVTLFRKILIKISNDNSFYRHL